MKLTVLGASGGIGRQLVGQAVAAGHEVVALVRPSTPFDGPQGVRVVRGEALDPAILGKAIEGSDAVLSALGQRRAGRSPWATLLSPPDLLTTVAGHLVELMPRAGIDRLVVVSAGGVRESRSQLTAPTRWLVDRGNIAVSYRDLARMEKALEASSLDWLAVRPVTLLDGPFSGRAAPVRRYRFSSIVRRADVAGWMLQAVAHPGPFTARTVLLGRGASGRA